VTGLAPNTRYYVTPTQGGTVGAETSFVTGKPLGADVATRFVVYADMATSMGAGASATAARTAALLGGDGEPDFLLHVGDLSYGEGNVATWEAWMDDIEPYSGRLPYHISIGNHGARARARRSRDARSRDTPARDASSRDAPARDARARDACMPQQLLQVSRPPHPPTRAEYDYEGDSAKDPSGVTRAYKPAWWNVGSDSGGECGVAVARRFRMPANGNGVFWYSFSVGNVHVVMLSSEHDPSPAAPMGAWLAADLASVDRALTPWVLVGIHRPLVETEM
jgi:hypothetical protein